MKLPYKKVSEDEKNAYNLWVEQKDPEYHMLGNYVDAYKSGNKAEIEKTGNIMASYDDVIKTELIDLFDAKIHRLVSRGRLSESEYYKNMKKHFVNAVFWNYHIN